MRAKRIALIGSLALAIVAFAGCGKEVSGSGKPVSDKGY